MKIPMTIIQWIVTLALVAFLPCVAVAQTSQERIDQARTQALETGIPISLLESKIAEGRAKGIAMERIASAVESRLRNLEQAKLSMGHGADDVDAAQLSVGADAIAAGVGEGALENIAASAGRDRRAVAVAALTQLVLHGIDPQVALIRVKDALVRGPQALANLAAQTGKERGSAGASRGSIPSTKGTPHTGDLPAPTPAQRPAKPPVVPARGRGTGRGGH